MDDFKILIKAVLDTSGINGNELSKVQKIAEKYTVNIKTKLDDKQALSQFNEVWSKIVAEANKSSNVKLPLKIDDSVLAKSVAQVNAELAKIDKTVADYTEKISQFKSTNNEILSGLSKPLVDFENKLNGLKNGTYTINEVANAYKNLKTEASNITANFSKQLSPIDSAIKNIAKGEETIKGLKAQNQGLANSSKEVNTELNRCASLLRTVKKIESEEGGTANWSNAYRQYADAIDNVKAKLSALQKEQANSANTQVFKIQDLKDNKIAYMSKVYNTIGKQMERINSMAKSQGWSIVDISGIEKADGKISNLTLKIRDAEGALKSLNMQRAQLQGNGKAQPGLMQVGDVKVLETASQAQTKLAQETEKANAKLAEQSKLSISDGNISTQIETLSNGYKKLGLSAEEVMSKMRNVTIEYSALESMLKSGASNADIANQFNKMNSVLKQTQNDLKQTRSEYSLLATTQQRLTLANTIEAWNQKNTAATQQVRQANEQYIASLRDLNTQMTLVEKNNIATSFKRAENSMRSMGKLGLALKDQWKQAVSSFSVWLSASTAVMKVVSETRQAFTEIKEIDTLLTEISKTDWSLTSSDLKQIGSNAFSVASDYGKTATDYLSGVKDMSRAGYDNAEAMAELSVAAQGAGDMTSEVANKMVIATDKAYKMNGSVDELTKTLDGVNWINIMVQLYGNT